MHFFSFHLLKLEPLIFVYGSHICIAMVLAKTQHVLLGQTFGIVHGNCK